MQGKLTQPLDLMAAIDKESRSAQVVDVDHVWIVDHRINHVGKVAQFTLAFGGKDASGKLHMCPARRESQLTQITIQGADFCRLFETAEGNPLRSYPQEFLDSLFADLVLPAANKFGWGMDEVEISVDGKVAFQVQKEQKISA